MTLLHQMGIMEAVQEICMDEAEGAAPPWLDKDYVEIIENKEAIKAEFKKRAKSLGKCDMKSFVWCTSF